MHKKDFSELSAVVNVEFYFCLNLDSAYYLTPKLSNLSVNIRIDILLQ